MPKHTIGSQLLTVRRDKRERAAFAATQDEGDFEEEGDESEEGFSVSLGEDIDSEESSTTYSE